jgi:uncharacterized protein (DUF2164 family)
MMRGTCSHFACLVVLTAQPPMKTELPKEIRQQAVASIERYFAENFDEKIGNMAAGSLLRFFMEEIAPSIYNQAVSDVRERLQARLEDLDYEMRQDEFQHWRRDGKPRQ